MGEPLKDKRWDGYVNTSMNGRKAVGINRKPNGECLFVEDVKSAVEWLKKQIVDNPDWNDEADIQYLHGLIDEAFEDVG